ncbi:MAG: hypothetical protein ACRDTG_28425 [Pseudonocardiaceae bacterium]
MDDDLIAGIETHSRNLTSLAEALERREQPANIVRAEAAAAQAIADHLRGDQ